MTRCDKHDDVVASEQGSSQSEKLPLSGREICAAWSKKRNDGQTSAREATWRSLTGEPSETSVSRWISSFLVTSGTASVEVDPRALVDGSEIEAAEETGALGVALPDEMRWTRRSMSSSFTSVCSPKGSRLLLTSPLKSVAS